MTTYRQKVEKILEKLETGPDSAADRVVDQLVQLHEEEIEKERKGSYQDGWNDATKTVNVLE